MGKENIMPIVYNEDTKTFLLQTKNTSYIMRIVKSYLCHLYWGKKVRGFNLANLPVTIERPLSPNPDPQDYSFSLDTVPLEYPAYGNSDFRTPACYAQYEDGSSVTNLQYKSHSIIKGKPEINGLPATYIEKEDEAETLKIELLDSKSGLKVILSYTVFNEYDAITRSVHFINESNAKVCLSKALSMSLDFPDSDYETLRLTGAWARENHIVKQKLVPGMQSVESRRGATGPQANPFFALLTPGTDEKKGEVYACSLIYSGSFYIGTEVDQYHMARFFAGINPFDFSWLLMPNEEFQTPEAVLVYSSQGLGGMSRTYHKLYRERLCRGKYRDKERPVLVNNWEATYFDFNESKIINLAKKASELGIELLVLDDGWFGKRNDDTSSLGDWFVNKEKLPNGLKGLAEKVNREGLKFGLWIEPEMISADSDLYRKHPDWCLHVAGRSRSEGRHQLVLDFSREDVRIEIEKMLTEILCNVPIAYVKWDMNRNMTEIGSELLPHERQRETGHRYMLGLYDLLEKLTAAFPDILFESCASGGGRCDPGMLHYMPQCWISDDTDAVERIKIQYGTSLVYPSSAWGCHVSAVPNHQVGRITSLKTRGMVAMSGDLGYELDLNKLNEDKCNLIREQIKFNKRIKKIVFFGDMYRLSSPFEKNYSAWMYVTGDKKEAFVTYVKILAEANEPLISLKLDGLNENFEYEIIGESQTIGGDELMNIGLPVPILKGDYICYSWILKA